jgi:cytochrome c2
LDAGNNVVAAISIFESRTAADAADEMVADWIKQHLTSFVSSPPKVMEGEVIAQQAK